MGIKNPSWALVIVLSILLAISGGIIIMLLLEKSSPAGPALALPVTPVTETAEVSPTPIPATTSSVIILNKNFNFPILDGQGNKAGEIAFVLTKVERTNTIDIAGQTATALPGRILILINAELTNDSSLGAVMAARNYVRLMVNGVNKLAAPDYHSDPVDMQAKSTKVIRMGFNIADTDRNIILQVGELEGKKELIPLNF